MRLAAGVLSAIRKHARRVKSGRSYFTVDQHMDAIIALTKSIATDTNLVVDGVGSCANIQVVSEKKSERKG